MMHKSMVTMAVYLWYINTSSPTVQARKQMIFSQRTMCSEAIKTYFNMMFIFFVYVLLLFLYLNNYMHYKLT